MKEGERKIPTDTAMVMVVVAVVFDILNIIAELIPFAGIFIGFIIDVLLAGIFLIWFDHYEIKLFAGNNMWGSAAALVANAFPVTDLAFPWAIRVGLLAFSERKEVPKQTAPQPATGWRL